MITRLTTPLLAGAAALLALQASASAQGIHLNELYVSHSGSDTKEFIELKGPAGASLDNYVVCVVEGDYGTSGAEPGKLDRAYDLTGYTIPTSGYFVLGEPAVTPVPDYIVDFFASGQDTFENGTDTFYLVNCGNGTNTAALVAQLATDIDAANAPDDDMVTTIPTLGTIADSVAMVDCGYLYTYPTGTSSPNTSIDRVYDSAPVTGPDGVCNTLGNSNAQGGFLAAGIYRGLDYPSGWCADFLDFNELANTFQPRTPGALNSVCPSAPPSSINYCTAGTTTNGCNATMSSSGTPSVAATSGFNVNVSTVEGAKTGIIFYGATGAVATPWGIGGSSYLCVKAPTQRTATQSTGGTNNTCGGSMTLDLLAYLNANPGAIGGSASASPFLAGSNAWLQGWFRDPPAVKTTSLSDGLQITFVP